MVVLGCGGRHRHGCGQGGVGARQPVVALVLVTETHGGVVIARPVNAVLAHHAAVLAVLAVVPLPVPAPLPLQGPAQVVGVEGEAPGLALPALGGAETLKALSVLLDKPIIA